MTLLEHTLLWFGAAISLNGVAAGALLATSNLSGLSLVVGQIFGCVLLGLGGRIGAITGRNSMECISLSLGQWPMIVVSVLGTIYQVGCITVTFGVASRLSAQFIGGSVVGWCIILACCSLLWLYLGQTGRYQWNCVGVIVMLILCLLLCLSYRGSGIPIPGKVRTFAHSVWISAALPISFLPMAADSVCRQLRARAAYWMTALACGIGSLIACSMGILFVNHGVLGFSDGLAICFVLLGTLTTIYLYARSAGIAMEQAISRVRGNWISLLSIPVGALLAVITPVSWIGDIFIIACAVMIPLLTIVFMDFFVLHHYDTNCRADVHNLLLWGVCILLSLLLMRMTHFGELLTAVLTAGLCAFTHKLRKN